MLREQVLDEAREPAIAHGVVAETAEQGRPILEFSRNNAA